MRGLFLGRAVPAALNIEHRTSHAERRTAEIVRGSFFLRCSMFDVRRSMFPNVR